jgi:exonuclease VII large subunit
MARPVKQESELPLFTAAASRKFLTISELIELIKGTLETQLDAQWVQGEISNFRMPSSGHFYFTLKDDRSQINAVMFRRQGARLRFTPENGMAVLCHGRVSVYSLRGDLQLYVEDLEPQGQGALYLAFEQLKNKLAAEGLFAAERKRFLPFLPGSVGIVTSERGAALHDILRILGDRYSDRRVVIRPVKVQGEGAAKEIADGIADLNRLGGVDVMIVGRGGGSLEDLWAFNEEIVARAPTLSPTSARPRRQRPPRWSCRGKPIYWNRSRFSSCSCKSAWISRSQTRGKISRRGSNVSPTPGANCASTSSIWTTCPSI